MELDKATFDKYVEFLRDEKGIKTKEDLIIESVERASKKRMKQHMKKVELK